MKTIIIVSLLILSLCNGASAWHEGFDYRIPIEINNSENPALTNYQFNVSFTSGINESSIRVVNGLYDSTVPHWCENETDGLCYELWFNVSVGSEINNNYYIYYGNNEVSSASNYDDVFTKTYNDSGLVLELHMDEGTGFLQTNDTSGEGNHGTLTNMNTTGNATSGWQGTDGGQWDGRSDMVFSTGDHLRFDGTNDYLSPSQILYNSNFTIGFWAKPKYLTNYQMIFDDSTETHARGGISVISNKWGMREKLADGTALLTSTQLELNKWQYVVFVHENMTGKIYYNGALDNSLYPFNAITRCDKIGYGAESADVGYSGMLDEVRIYNRALSEDEIYRQYIRSKYAVDAPTVTVGEIEIYHEFVIGATSFYDELTDGLTDFRDGMSKYLVWGILFFAIGLSFTLFAKIKYTLIGSK